MSSPTSSPTGPLAALRVIDLTQMLAGPYCTMLLADLGADVIKVEPPDGDVIRSTGPFRKDDAQRAFGGYFASINRNKRSIVLDLKTSGARDILRALVRDAAVVVENFRSGVMDRLELSYESLHEINPRLVYAAIRGFGDPRTGESPYVDWPAFDVVAQAMGGFMGITGTSDGTPMKAGPGVGDIFPASLAALGIVSAVYHAQRTGEGQFVDVAMYDAVLSLCERIVYQHSFENAVPRPEGNVHPMLCPFGIFETRDGYVTIAAPSDKHWNSLCRLMQQPELLGDQRFETKQLRKENSDHTHRAVGDWTGRHTTREVVDILAGSVPVGPVNSVADIFADPHVQARNMLVEVEHPGCAEPVVIAGVPIKLTKTSGQIRRRAPRLGEHTDEILSELGHRPDADVKGATK